MKRSEEDHGKKLATASSADSSSVSLRNGSVAGSSSNRCKILDLIFHRIRCYQMRVIISAAAVNGIIFFTATVFHYSSEYLTVIFYASKQANRQQKSTFSDRYTLLLSLPLPSFSSSSPTSSFPV